MSTHLGGCCHVDGLLVGLRVVPRQNMNLAMKLSMVSSHWTNLSVVVHL